MVHKLSNLYTILGVQPTDSPEEIRKAYRNASRRFHPDVNKHYGAANQFKSINEAYETLSDPIKRQAYDIQQPTGEISYFSIQTKTSRTILPELDEPQVIYALIELMPDKMLRTDLVKSNSTPLNLTLVVDISSSMGGTSMRLDRTKTAANQIIENLSTQDILSIVTFNDFADVSIKAAPLKDKAAAKSYLAPLSASGGTEIYKGLLLGYEENRRYANKEFINHIVLITDGRTFGDEAACLQLAERAAKEGIGISAIGLGEEWNDAFLDKLVGLTGGLSQYIHTAGQVISFLNDHIRRLSDALADRVMMSLAPDPDVKIETVFRLSPNPGPVPVDIDPIPVGQLQPGSNMALLVQCQLPAITATPQRGLLRIDVTGDIVREKINGYKAVHDILVAVKPEPEYEDPPLAILDALGKLTLYKMQQKAEEALARGDTAEASQRYQTLATRYLDAGETALATVALTQAQMLNSNSFNSNTVSSKTIALMDVARKELKYGTRMLLDKSKENS